MKTLTKHQIAGNKSHIFMVCDIAMSIRQKLALLEFTRFHCETVVVCFVRLCSAVPNQSRHCVNKIASKCMQYPTRKQQYKEKVTDFAITMPFIWNYSCCCKSCHQMEALQCTKYILQETVVDLCNHLYYLVMKS